MTEKEAIMTEQHEKEQRILDHKVLKRKRKEEKKEMLKTGKWSRCMYFIKQKARYCTGMRNGETLYCVHHAQDVDGTRVPCPLDPAHTVLLHDLTRHLTVCNQKKVVEYQQALSYYQENINTNTDLKSEWKHIVEGTKEPLLQRLERIDFADLFEKINTTFTTFFIQEIPTEVLQHEKLTAFRDEKISQKSGRKVLRHLAQQSSILGHMDANGFLQEEHVFVELGAGRGVLSNLLSMTVPNCNTVLIDRANCRRKADVEIRERSGTSCERALIDIRHLNFGGMTQLNSSDLIAHSKHLCGVATDLSLRALTKTLPKTSDENISPKLKGIAIALCCHQKCEWDEYINPSFFINQGFTPADFHLLMAMSSWAICGFLDENELIEKTLGLTTSDRVQMGRRCKRLIDAGRVQYLKDLGLNVRLVHYCHEDDSPENCFLIAKP